MFFSHLFYVLKIIINLIMTENSVWLDFKERKSMVTFFIEFAQILSVGELGDLRSFSTSSYTYYAIHIFVPNS